MVRGIACSVGVPVSGPESIIDPLAITASLMVAPSSGSRSGGWITGRTVRPNERAKSKSRSSWAGTAMMAPVP